IHLIISGRPISGGIVYFFIVVTELYNHIIPFSEIFPDCLPSSFIDEALGTPLTRGMILHDNIGIEIQTKHLPPAFDRVSIFVWPVGHRGVPDHKDFDSVVWW